MFKINGHFQISMSTCGLNSSWSNDALQWSHTECDGVLNHRRLDCLLNCLVGYREKNESSASLGFVRGIHRWSVNSPHKRPVTGKMFPFDCVIMHLCICKLGHRWYRWGLVACSLPNHYLNHGWFAVLWTIRNKFQGNLGKTNHYMFCEMSAILCRPPCVQYVLRTVSWCFGVICLLWAQGGAISNRWVSGRKT